MKVAEVVFKELSNFTRTIFGNPGTTELSLLKYLPGHMNYVLSLHDGHALGMASGYHLYTGRVGVTNTHAAPGLTNSLGYVYSARLDRIPLLILVGQQNSRKLIDEPILSTDLREIPYAKGVIDVRYGEEVPKAILRGVKTAVSSPPGPVIVGIPYDIVDEEIDTQVEEIHPMIAQVNYQRQCDPSIISLLAEELNRARRIAIVAGYEVDITDAHEELKELSSKLKAPVFAEPHFSRSPSAEFVKILPRNASGINSALSEYDVVLLVGGMLHNVLYMDEELRTRNVIQITSDSEEATKRAWRSILCDPKSFLKEILPKVTEREGSNVLDLKVKEGRVGEIMKALSSRLNGYAVFEETPSHKEPVKMILGRRRRLYFSNRSGFLGWAIPASIGYIMAGGNAVTLVGDGSFHFAPQALWTATNYDIDLRVLILNNEGYESLRSRADYSAPFFSPKVSPLRVAEAYGFETLETESINDGLDWLMEKGVRRRVLEVKV